MIYSHSCAVNFWLSSLQFLGKSAPINFWTSESDRDRKQHTTKSVILFLPVFLPTRIILYHRILFLLLSNISPWGRIPCRMILISHLCFWYDDITFSLILLMNHSTPVLSALNVEFQKILVFFVDFDPVG